jgi:hypothetical protein
MVAAIETTASTTEMSEAEATTERAVRRGSEFSGALERPEPPSQARHTGQPPLPLALDRPDLYKSALLKSRLLIRDHLSGERCCGKGDNWCEGPSSSVPTSLHASPGRSTLPSPLAAPKQHERR